MLDDYQRALELMFLNQTMYSFRKFMPTQIKI